MAYTDPFISKQLAATPSADYFLLTDGTDNSWINAATARTKLGLVAGGAGDIWVEKAGDTMTGALTLADLADALKSGDYAIQMQSGEQTVTDDAYVFDTSVTHTTGNLFDWKNNGTSKLSLNGYGHATFTPTYIASSNVINIPINLGSGFGAGQTGIKITATGSGLLQGQTIPLLSIDSSSMTGVIAAPINIYSKTFGNGGANYGMYTEMTGVGGFGHYILDQTTSGGYGMYIQKDNSTSGSLFRGSTGNANFEGEYVRLEMNQDSKKANFLNCVRFNSGDFNGQRFIVDAAGNVITNAALVIPRGTFGQIENLLKYSEDFSNAVWVKNNVNVAANNSSAPDLTANAADYITRNASNPPTVSQTIAGTVTASKTFVVQGWLRTKNSGFPTIEARLDSGNETGTKQTIAGTSDVNRWKFFKFTQSFTSGSTAGLTLTFGEFESNFDIQVDVWGFSVAEAPDAIGYTATGNAQVVAQRGGSINGHLHIGGDKTSAHLMVRESGNQGSTNLMSVQDTDGIAQIKVDSNFSLTTKGRIENINTTAKTGAYNITATDDNIVCDTSGGAFTITLPASPETGRVYTVILETAGNNLTVSGNGNNINGSSTLVMTSAGSAAQLIYNGTQWNIK